MRCFLRSSGSFHRSCHDVVAGNSASMNIPRWVMPASRACLLSQEGARSSGYPTPSAAAPIQIVVIFRFTWWHFGSESVASSYMVALLMVLACWFRHGSSGWDLPTSRSEDTGFTVVGIAIRRHCVSGQLAQHIARAWEIRAELQSSAGILPPPHRAALLFSIAVTNDCAEFPLSSRHRGRSTGSRWIAQIVA